MRTLLSYRRAQEFAADRAALTYLNATHQSAKGMVTTFQRFADQQLVSAQYADPYAQTHPMARDRLQQLETSARKSPYWDATDSAELQFRHDMMRAKLSGFTESPSAVGRRYPSSDNSLPAQYARAIVAYRTGSTRDAVRAIDALIARMPRLSLFLRAEGADPAGSGPRAARPSRRFARPSRWRRKPGSSASCSARPSCRRATTASSARPSRSDNRPRRRAARRRSATAISPPPTSSRARSRRRIWRRPQGLLIDGDIDSAKDFAPRAQAKFATGSPGWLKADDIIGYEAPNSSN